MKTVLFTLLAGLFFITCDSVEDVQATYGAEANPTGDAIGGGKGYRRMVLKSDCIVETAEELVDALEKAVPGKVILVASGATLDLTGHLYLEIPEGVTLAGDRGKDGAEGPLIRLSNMPEESIFMLANRGVRITGLRIEGPDPDFVDIDKSSKPRSKSLCLAVKGEKVEIDNCEISNFDRGGIELYPGAKDVHVHHNFIHDVQAYPVVALNRSALPVLIEANIIHWVWHATAGSGYPGSGYEARYNIFIRKPVPNSWQPYEGGHAVDMHAYLNVEQEQNLLIAGDYVHVHHNTFANEAGNDPSLPTSFDAAIRGVPRFLATFYNNIFLHDQPAQTIYNERGNLWVYNNLYGPEKKLIPIDPATTPQILLISPPQPDVEAPLLSGETIPVNIRINMLDTLQLKHVLIELNGKTIYSGASVPAPGALSITKSMLGASRPYHMFTVKATDRRNVTGTHNTIFRTP
jgi:hypothetical protein